MIWKKILPPEGGGALRRLVRIRKEMFEHSLDKQSKSSFDKTSLPLKPLTIIDFQRPDDAADARAVSIGSKQQGWRISDDEVIGGFSCATLTLWNEHSKKISSSSSTENLPFVRWTGNIDTRIGPKSRAKRSGFCAIRCPEFPLGGIPVGEKYNALEIKCRTDGRAYTFNLKIQSYFPDDLYQSLITVQPEEVLQEYKRQNQPLSVAVDRDSNSSSSTDSVSTTATTGTSAGGGFISVVLPFRDFVLTSYGRMKAQQRNLDGGIQIEHLGITLMDGKDGPFTFDLARIRLVNYSAVEEKIMNDDPLEVKQAEGYE